MIEFLEAFADKLKRINTISSRRNSWKTSRRLKRIQPKTLLTLDLESEPIDLGTLVFNRAGSFHKRGGVLGWSRSKSEISSYARRLRWQHLGDR